MQDARTKKLAQIEFIEEDCAKRSEEITSDISWIGNFFSLKVKKIGDKRAKTVNYSTVEMNGTRLITLK